MKRTLDGIIQTHSFHVIGLDGDDTTTKVDEIAKADIKKFILDLFREAEYEPYKFVDKVQEL